MVPLSVGKFIWTGRNMNINYLKHPMEKPLFAPFRPFSLLVAFFLILSIASVQAQTGYWSNPTTWGGALPVAGSTVTIAPGQTVILDVSPPNLKGIQVRGTLIFADTDINLTTGYILVTGGEFRIGSETAPYAHKATITFTGGTSDVTGMGLGNKFLMVMGGGKLELHGSRAAVQSWTQLRKNAAVSNVMIETVEPMNWRVGDQIVIAPSGTDAGQTEVRTISMISGNQIRVTPALSFPHYGRIDTVAGYAIDMRAEVGLLTRDIVLQGDAYSESIQMGGHVMIMNGSHAKVEGVEFYRMGWYGEQGRYPMHWHLSGDSYGEYARNNSVNHSFHRGFVVHGTNGVTVNNNVAYDVFSHCYVVAEDGNEMNNTFIGNLGLLTKRIPDIDDFAFPGGQFSSLQSERHPGTFWLTNPNNIVRNNHAAGSLDGIGFFYDGAGTATSVPVNFFTGNLSHSNGSTDGSYDRAHYRTTGWALFVTAGLENGNTMNFSGFTGYKNTLGGAWLEGDQVYLENSVLSDNGTGVNLQASSLNKVALINSTPNQIEPSSKDYGAINVFTSFDFGNKEPKILDVDVIGFDKRIMVEADAADIFSFIRNVDFIGGSGPRIKIDRDYFKGALVDRRGMVSGTGTPTIYFGRNYDFHAESCVVDGPANALKCSARDYLNLEISSDIFDANPVGQLRLTRNDGVSEDMFESEIIKSWEPAYGHRQILWIPANEVFQLSFVDEPMPSEFFVKIQGVTSGNNKLVMTIPSGKVPRIVREDGTLIPSAPSLAGLSSSSDGWFFDEADNKLHLVITVSSGSSLEKRLMVRLIPGRLANESIEAGSVSAIPNPFQNQLNIQFSVMDENAATSLRLFNTDGRVVYELTDQNFGVGPQSISIDGTKLSPGTYIYELRSGSQNEKGSIIRIQD